MYVVSIVTVATVTHVLLLLYRLHNLLNLGFHEFVIFETSQLYIEIE